MTNSRNYTSNLKFKKKISNLASHTQKHAEWGIFCNVSRYGNVAMHIFNSISIDTCFILVCVRAFSSKSNFERSKMQRCSLDTKILCNKFGIAFFPSLFFVSQFFFSLTYKIYKIVLTIFFFKFD